MADNLNIRAGGAADPEVATDNVAGAHYQRVKLDWGAEGAAAPATGPTTPALEGTDITGAALPAGGASTRGWLSAIWKALTDRLPTALISNRLAVDGSGVTQPVSGTVAVSNLPATQPVSGTFWQATQTVSGTVTADAGAGPWPVTDNGGSLTVDTPQLPSTLGQQPMAASLPVVLASDQSPLGPAVLIDGFYHTRVYDAKTRAQLGRMELLLEQILTQLQETPR